MEKIWPQNNEMGIGWTEKYPRPKEGGPHHPSLVEFRQRQWDEAEKMRVRVAEASDRIRADRAARKEAEREATEAREEARRQAKNGETEAMLHRRFIAAGGSESEWQAEKSEVIAEHRRRLVAQGDVTEQAKRQAQASLYQNF